MARVKITFWTFFFFTFCTFWISKSFWIWSQQTAPISDMFLARIGMKLQNLVVSYIWLHNWGWIQNLNEPNAISQPIVLCLLMKRPMNRRPLLPNGKPILPLIAAFDVCPLLISSSHYPPLERSPFPIFKYSTSAHQWSHLCNRAFKEDLLFVLHVCC